MAKPFFFKNAVNRLVVAKVGKTVKAYSTYRGNGNTLYMALGNSQRLSFGRATGKTVKADDGSNWYQITLYKSVQGATTAYVSMNDVLLYPVATDSISTPLDGEKVLKDLIVRDQQVSKNLILATAQVSQMKPGTNRTNAERVITALAAKLKVRQDHIKESGLVKFQEATTSAMDSIKDFFGIGFIVTVPTAIAAGSLIAVGVGAAIALYFVFKPSYDESKTDLKISKDLAKLLEKEDPVVAQKIKDDIEKQIDDAYNQGNTDGTFGGMFEIIKPLAYAAVGFYLVTKVPALIAKVQNG
jgi:uncharacterized membrane protein